MVKLNYVVIHDFFKHQFVFFDMNAYQCKKLITYSKMNQEIYTLNSELDDINNELRYYEQRVADRKAAIKAAKEQTETQNFELDRRINLPTLYDKKGR
ncbi:MAG: hypothetical protein EZS28_006215 [Streblomastix strix]|uniref:Uncharacterized protein n=1 Tax=Streblomastix strix TaxID=222440 RepID=A0A5J4WT70_9EUKA|nr:MAG: hypothetical protein EZS28_006215 [Streblomastix strix]